MSIQEVRAKSILVERDLDLHSYFLGRIKAKHPKLLGEYLNIYPGHEWGQADKTYYHSIDRAFNWLSSQLA